MQDKDKEIVQMEDAIPADVNATLRNALQDMSQKFSSLSLAI